MANLFDEEKIIAQMERIGSIPPFVPDKYEMRFSVTQLFSTGNDAVAHKEVTLKFVLRDGEMIFYESSEKPVWPNEKNYKP